ncbi:lipoyl(octanoyl) transferase LipB [Candidatus Omnitrophota bacterium]
MQLEIRDLGLVDFEKAWNLQKEIFLAIKNTKGISTLIFCSHHPVITMGRRAESKNILADEQALRAKGIRVHQIERGGDVTYHGPGQLTVYPVIDLSKFKKDIHLYLRTLEEIVIDLLGDFGVRGKRCAGRTGVWVEGKKIASIGIAIRNWIAFHGISINIKAGDLANFSMIRPCGMDIRMTSLESILGREVSFNDIKNSLILKSNFALGTPNQLKLGVSPT